MLERRIVNLLMKKIFIILLIVILSSCYDFKTTKNSDITLNYIGLDYLKIEKQQSEGFYGISLSTKFDKYELNDITSLYIIGYYPDIILEKYGGCKSFYYELKNENNGLNEECIHSFLANDLDEQMINEIIELIKNVKIELYVDDKIVDIRYIEIKQ